MLRIGVLVSGGGTNFQAILHAVQNGQIPDAEISILISNNPKAYALERAKKAGIPVEIVSRKHYTDGKSFDSALSSVLRSHQVDLVLLAGFMSILGDGFFEHFKHRVMNIHPALIPSFSGPGYYGLKVHQAVLDYGVKVTGATVHFVTPEVDAGPVILQKVVDVRTDDTPETLQQRVMEEAEWKIYPEAVRLFAEGRLNVDGRIVHIAEDKHY